MNKKTMEYFFEQDSAAIHTAYQNCAWILFSFERFKD